MITSNHLMDLGFIPMPSTVGIVYSINEKCQGVLSGGVFYFKLSKDGNYLQAKNVNHLKWLYKREHKENVHSRMV